MDAGAIDVLQGAAPSLLPAQPQGLGVGPHRVGALGLGRPDRLDGAERRDLPVEAVRHQRLLVRLCHLAANDLSGVPVMTYTGIDGAGAKEVKYVLKVRAWMN